MRKSILSLFTQNYIKSCSGGLRTKASENIEVSENVEVKPSKKNKKLLKIAVIGTPNAGKSTFINSLLNHRICPTSSKVHTTRTFAKAIGIRNNAQIILFDTPGLVTEQQIKKHHLTSEFTSSCRHSIQHADLICVIHDVSNSWTRNELHSTVLDTLKEYSTVPSFLILNKIDMLRSKRILLDITKTLTQNTLLPSWIRKPKSFLNEKKMIESNTEKAVGWPGFLNVFMIASLNHDGMTDVWQFLLRQARYDNWEYDRGEYTDRPPEELIVQCVRARLLEFLPQEIPYSLKCEIEFYDVYKGLIMTSVQVTCPTERIERLICGIENGKIKQITERATSDLVETFRKPITLTISVVSKLKSN